jgi:hypothetical protein
MKLIHFLPVLLIVAVLSCEKDKNESPAYVGNWVRTEADTLSLVPLVLLENKMEMKLQVGSWEMISKIRVTGYITDWEEYMGMRGTLTVSGEDATITFAEIGVRNFDMQTMTFIDDEITWYNANDNPNEYGYYLDEYGPGIATQEAKFIVSGNTLTVKADDNGNGTIEEEEILVFTKG